MQTNIVTKEVAEKATYRQIFYHVVDRGSDKKAIRVRVSGKCQTWKTRPEEFRLPVKHGLYENGAITHLNASQWSTIDPTQE